MCLFDIISTRKHIFKRNTLELCKFNFKKIEFNIQLILLYDYLYLWIKQLTGYFLLIFLCQFTGRISQIQKNYLQVNNPVFKQKSNYK